MAGNTCVRVCVWWISRAQSSGVRQMCIQGEALLILFICEHISCSVCVTIERESLQSILPADKTLTLRRLEHRGVISHFFDLVGFSVCFFKCSATAAPVYGSPFTPSVILLIHTTAAPMWLHVCTVTPHTFDTIMFKHSSAEQEPIICFLPSHVLSWNSSPHPIWVLIFSLPAHLAHFSKMAVERLFF